MGSIKSWIKTASGRISAFVSGQSYPVEPDHPNYEVAQQALRDDDADAFVKAVDVPLAITEYTHGQVKVLYGEVFFGERRIHTLLTDRLLAMMKAGLPFEPFVVFLENLMQNPSKRAVDELYRWLEHQDIPITMDGCWLGYKRLYLTPEMTNDDRAIYVDCHSSSIKQSIGDVISMPRNEVDDNFGVACSEGYHVGSMKYVDGFNSGHPIVVVKVNPKDVVSVPEGETHKCRVAAYQLMGMYTETFSGLVYNVAAPGEPITRLLTKEDLRNAQRAVDAAAAPVSEPTSPTDGAVEQEQEAPADDSVDEDQCHTIVVTFDGKLDVDQEQIVDSINESLGLSTSDNEANADGDMTWGYSFELGDPDFDRVDDVFDDFKARLDNLKFVKSVELDPKDEDELRASTDNATEDFVAPTEAETDDTEENDKSPNDVVITFEGYPTEVQLTRIDEIAPYTQHEKDEDRIGDDKVVGYHFDDLSDAEDFRNQVMDFRFVRSAVINPKVSEPDQFPISFVLQDKDGNVISSHAVRNENEEEIVLQTARKFHPDARQLRRDDSRNKS